ncbi:hypothetical protein HERIO_1566 [Hepatospora eriocheir]|uniref:Uncharacterized protein n=1 Tax=Hepatospora eriocheir TaxID=1081669 RepID=A0A1X0Q9T9_9MICR|nr:hypothetical protein HERIO_1566 [Hepatospora eriocheir]
MNIKVQFLTNNKEKSCILTVNRHQYIFNMFEGYQRVALNYNMTILSPKAIFLSYKYSMS